MERYLNYLNYILSLNASIKLRTKTKEITQISWKGFLVPFWTKIILPYKNATVFNKTPTRMQTQSEQEESVSRYLSDKIAFSSSRNSFVVSELSFCRISMQMPRQCFRIKRKKKLGRWRRNHVDLNTKPKNIFSVNENFFVQKFADTGNMMLWRDKRGRELWVPNSANS